MLKRTTFLVTLIAVAAGVAGCGRASQAEIDQALSITPTATPSQEQVAASTAAAASALATQTAAASNPAGQVAALGDVTRGSRQFTVQCAGCHRPGGPGGDILAPGGPGADVAPDALLTMLRQGTGHPVPPGPYSPSQLSDSAIHDLAAFIRSRAAP